MGIANVTSQRVLNHTGRKQGTDVVQAQDTRLVQTVGKTRAGTTSCGTDRSIQKHSMIHLKRLRRTEFLRELRGFGSLP